MLMNKVVVVVLIKGMMPGQRSLATSVTHRPRLGGKVCVRLKLVQYFEICSIYVHTRAHIGGENQEEWHSIWRGCANSRNVSEVR